MKYLLPLLFLLAGCNPPQVDSCRLNLNFIDAAIKNAPSEATRDDLVELVHSTVGAFCIPIDPNQPGFYRPLEQGEHLYDNINWNILMKWINDNSK